MMSTSEAAPEVTGGRSRRRAGYVVSIVVNAAIVIVVNNLLAWELLPWLTDDFDRVLPVVNLSLLATIAVNVVYLWFDPDWFRSSSQIALNVISIAAIVRMWQVFPFDFSAYDFDWDVVVRILLVVAFAGTVIGIVAEAVKLVGSAFRRPVTP
jgi:hypothetical protein